MRSYWLPGFQSRLLSELQRQQNNTIFCDTLLQTDGVSVPAHGCVLAALSPYLSQKLSASPCPPAGQKRKVKLQAVNAQTLLKLVGLLYSGLLEVNETTDQADVLAAANQLGFDRLVEGQGDVRGEEAEGEQLICGICRKGGLLAKERKEREELITCNVEVQVGTEGKQDVETQVEGTGFVHAATQTIGAQSDVCPSSSPQNTSIPRLLTPSPITALLDETGLSNDVQFDRVPDVAAAPIFSNTSMHEVTKTTTTTTTISSAPGNTWVASELSNCTRPKQRSLHRNNRKTCARGMAGGGKKEATEGRPTQTKGNKMRKWRVKDSGGKGSPTRMTAMGLVKTREISVKVKLRRVKQQGQMWEVVHMRDIGERLTPEGSQAVFAALKKDGAKILRPQTEGTRVQSTTSTSQLCPVNKQQCPIMSFTLPGHPPHDDVSTDVQSTSSLCSRENNDTMLALLSQAQCPVEESDREIEKLLEDIMMGLNILPSTGPEKDSDRSSFKSYSAPIASELSAVDWTGRHCQVGVVGCHDYKTQSEDTSSKDTVLHSRSSSCVVPATASTTSVHYKDTGPQTESESNQIAQEQPGSSPHQSFIQGHTEYHKHKRQGDTMDQSILRSEPLDCQYHQTLKAGSITHYTVNSGSQETDKSALKGITWLAETPQALQFPMSLCFKEGTKPSEPCDPCRPESMESQELLESSHHSTKVMRNKGKCSVKKLCVKGKKEKTQSSDSGCLTGPIPSFENAQKSNIEFKLCDIEDRPVTSNNKRKCRAYTHDASDHTLGDKEARHGDGICLSMCSVRLSCNNVLSKERTLNRASNRFKEPKVSDVTDVDKGFKKMKADQTITKSTTRNVPPVQSDPKTPNVERVEIIKRKVGRPRKIKMVPDKADPSTDQSHTLESDRTVKVKAKIGEECQQNDGKPKSKRRKNVVQSSDNVLSSCGVSALNSESPPVFENEQFCAQQHDPDTFEPNIHRTQTADSENTHTAEGQMSENPESSMNPAVKPAETKRTIVSFKEFKELINNRHIKTRGSKSKVESSEVKENVHLGGKTCDNTDSCEASTAETIIGLDISPTENITDVKFDQNQNQVITTEGQKDDQVPEREREEMGEVVLDRAPDEERLLEGPDEALDLANTTAQSQDPEEDFTLCCVSPSQQSNRTTTEEEEVEVDVLVCSPDQGILCCVSPSQQSNRTTTEEDEDVEVDVLVCSLDQGLQPTEYGEGFVIDASSDEEEEELKDIDVTGI
ncbi:BTB/POZ domain-containing protein 18 [Merluccius polli]|uniref:BTB/POZ domain-containing protein 18 n=1 Tax=Merluccius polli TaxID=89951 RepID=A0AA47NVD1_MERPO|nr:BTB/POZ domain-containing protein 18 [Merluccius polli]